MSRTIAVPKTGHVAAELIDNLGITLDRNGLTIRRGAEVPTKETWETIGRSLDMIANAWQWWVGDWINWGEALYGDEASDAAEPTTADRYQSAQRITGLEPQTLMNISSICRNVAKSRRRTPPLGFWIHQEVAKLEPEQQTEWLEEAIQSGMTKQQLRDAIRDATRTEPAPGDGPVEPSRTYRTPEEALHDAAVLVANQMQPNGDGTYTVPKDAAVQLLIALGRDPD